MEINRYKVTVLDEITLNTTNHVVRAYNALDAKIQVEIDREINEKSSEKVKYVEPYN